MLWAVLMGYTPCDKCVAKVLDPTLMATVDDQPVTVRLGYPS